MRGVLGVLLLVLPALATPPPDAPPLGRELLACKRPTIKWSTDSQRGLLLYVPISASRIRLLSCEATELARCTPYLDALAARLSRSQ